MDIFACAGFSLKIFETLGRTITDLQFLTRKEFSFLNNGVTCVSFNSFEISALIKQSLNIVPNVSRPCDTDTYFRNIIFSNISKILFMFFTDYFKLLSCSCAIKTLNLKFLTESKVKEKLYDLMAAKMTDELEIAYMSFYASYAVIIELDTKKSRGGKSGLGSGLLKRNERGAYNGILNELRLTDKEDFRKYLRMNTSKRNENNFFYHISLLLCMFSQIATRDLFVIVA